MGDELDLSQFKEVFVSEAKEHMSVLNAHLLELEKNPDNADTINEIFRAAHTLKGMAATMGFEKVTGLTHSMESILDKLRSKKYRATPETIEILFDCFDTLELLLDEIISEKDKGVDVINLLEKLSTVNLVSVEEEKKQEAQQGKPGQQPVQALQEAAQEQTEKKEAAGAASQEKQQQAEAALHRSQTVRIKVEHLDKLMNVVGELVIAKARLAQIAEKNNVHELTGVMNEISQFTIELQEEVLKTRMVPVKNIFDRYPRMVRDLSRKLGKEIEFIMTGAEIEIDRMLLDQINEPLVHLLRNAVGHGVESPDERKAAGKPVTGNVELESRREKGYVWIEVSDDGKGLDIELIRKKAVEKGLVSPEEALKMTESEVMMLICNPGFSTVDAITDISGRGVGMDVVKNLVEAFNGKLEIISKWGAETTFVIQLPLTLAIIQSLMVSIGGGLYAIPLTNVSEIIGVYREQIKSIEKREVLLLRNQVIPLIYLGRVFGITDYDTSAMKHFYVVIVEIGEGKLGLVVDDLTGKQEIVIKTLSGMLRYAKNFSGATILGDGRVILIIDVASIYGAQHG